MTWNPQLGVTQYQIYQNFLKPFIFWPPVLFNVLWLLYFFILYLRLRYFALRLVRLCWSICKWDVAPVFSNLCVVSKSPAEIPPPIGVVLELHSHTNLLCLVKLAPSWICYTQEDNTVTKKLKFIQTVQTSKLCCMITNPTFKLNTFFYLCYSSIKTPSSWK